MGRGHCGLGGGGGEQGGQRLFNVKASSEGKARSGSRLTSGWHFVANVVV